MQYMDILTFDTFPTPTSVIPLANTYDIDTQSHPIK